MVEFRRYNKIPGFPYIFIPPRLSHKHRGEEAGEKGRWEREPGGATKRGEGGAGGEKIGEDWTATPPVGILVCIIDPSSQASVGCAQPGGQERNHLRGVRARHGPGPALGRLRTRPCPPTHANAMPCTLIAEPRHKIKLFWLGMPNSW